MNNKGEVRRATFPQLKKATPMEALIMKIPIDVRYQRQAKYLKSTLPEALREVTGDLSEKRTAAAEPNPKTSGPSGISSLKRGIPRMKTKRKLVKVTGNIAQPWLNRLHPQNLQKEKKEVNVEKL